LGRTKLSRGASDLISGLPLIERVSRFYDGPDLRTAHGRTLWQRATNSLGQLVRDAEDEERQRIGVWHGDCLIACGRFEEAIAAMPVPDLLQKWSVLSSKVLALKLHIGAPVAACDVVGLFGPSFTKFGRENVEAVTQYLTVQLDAAQSERPLVATWAGDAHELEDGLPLFNGHPSYIIAKPPRGLSFDQSATAKMFCTKIIRDAENSWREEQGIPLVGEGWVSETRLYYQIKSAFPHLDVEQHARPAWLGRQHIDIFIPALSVAIEFQGLQHDQPVAFFGGVAAFEQARGRDARKPTAMQAAQRAPPLCARKLSAA
jgi:hypothetical protein